MLPGLQGRDTCQVVPTVVTWALASKQARGPGTGHQDTEQVIVLGRAGVMLCEMTAARELGDLPGLSPA